MLFFLNAVTEFYTKQEYKTPYIEVVALNVRGSMCVSQNMSQENDPGTWGD